MAETTPQQTNAQDPTPQAFEVHLPEGVTVDWT